MADPRHDGVSFVVPVRNGARWLDAVLAAILAQADGRPIEVIVVDDGSTDGSDGILQEHAARGRIRVVRGEERGAAAAVNLGVAHATHPIICQVDQDVILEPGWMARLTAALAEPDVAAAQGYYVTPRPASPWARVTGLDLELRYGGVRGTTVDHACTGNSAYRAEAFHKVGGLDETLGYGYDNDLSYRLGAAGYRLAFCREARSVHRWRESARGYLAQQYGLAYGRFDVVAKHPRRVAGDDVSGLGMLAHVVGMLFALTALSASALGAIADAPTAWLAPRAGAVLLLLAAERGVAGICAERRFRDAAGLWFVPIHLLRDIVWVGALLTWTARRLVGRTSRPSDSMRQAVEPRPDP